MKKIFIYVTLAGILGLTACKKWLDVTPKAETTKDVIFSSEKGFRDALTGAYIHMKGSNLYTGSMMWGAIEYMARTWDPLSTNQSILTGLLEARYADAGVRGVLDGMYGDLYKVVADVNSILEHIDNRRNIFTNDNYALIKGEALTLRAFTHFDVLRTFGPMPNNPGTTPVLPYVKKVSIDVSPLLTYDQFTTQLIADLDEAEVLMKDVDPITRYTLAELNPDESNFDPPVVNDDYYMYRQLRMNYYAVLALKARVYLWLSASAIANKTKASSYAQLVINAKSQNGTTLFRLGTAKDASPQDYTMTPEHITALSVYNLSDMAEGSFGNNGSLARNDFNVQDGYYYLNNLFPVAERATDVRYTNLWAYRTAAPTTMVINKKFIQSQIRPKLQVPLIRLSEMYMILAECAETKTEAETYYKYFCDQKGVPFANGFNNADWQTDRRNKLVREYAREFFAEGQSFFTYKRMNVTTLPAQWTYTYFNGNAARYVVPKPDREYNYLNK